jgi:hypothetical protein
MLFAIINNLPELILGVTWTGVVFSAGRRYQRWKTS